ncbi:hypothetical protein HZH66_015110 [Vespula vulgaris]|uniref:Uncharacterized protein n=1 Tax=Vespula vulgaris TaxID=7454 RepID=A0A834IXG2_VESVU|nr:hypothetical protein HZH66_015110 [Vespula vulgaris]
MSSELNSVYCGSPLTVVAVAVGICNGVFHGGVGSGVVVTVHFQRSSFWYSLGRVSRRPPAVVSAVLFPEDCLGCTIRVFKNGKKMSRIFIDFLTETSNVY